LKIITVSRVAGAVATEAEVEVAMPTNHILCGPSMHTHLLIYSVTHTYSCT